MPENHTNELMFEVLKSLQEGQARTYATLLEMVQQLMRVREDINEIRSDALSQESSLSTPQAQEAHLAALRQALIDGEQSGPATPFDFDQFIAEEQSTHSAGR